MSSLVPHADSPKVKFGDATQAGAKSGCPKGLSQVPDPVLLSLIADAKKDGVDDHCHLVTHLPNSMAEILFKTP